MAVTPRDVEAEVVGQRMTLDEFLAAARNESLLSNTSTGSSPRSRTGKGNAQSSWATSPWRLMSSRSRENWR